MSAEVINLDQRRRAARFARMMDRMINGEIKLPSGLELLRDLQAQARAVVKKNGVTVDPRIAAMKARATPDQGDGR